MKLKRDRAIYGLSKIPDKYIIEELRIELGKRNAYITELEDRLKTHGIRKIRMAQLEDRDRQILQLKEKLKDITNRNLILNRKLKHYTL